MTIDQINDLANTVKVARLELESLEAAKDEFLQNNAQYQELLMQIELASDSKAAAQSQLLEVMDGAGLKSWKTDMATFTKATRYSAAPNSAYKKAIENELKKGGEVNGWELKKTQYLSIKIN